MNEEFKDDESLHEIEGRYADAFRVGHSVYKFILDFGQIANDKGTTNYHTRIIFAPNIAKALHESIGTSLREFEDKYDQIKGIDQ